ncbi:hypothetical protein EPA93_29140 [Ktedonosporobacter rubrisoli]|uniref:Uncharacterized protein n=1 Tax=Ktedonosporobacter rubrisoli TaxID=2509675 RepID=A0A4P6JVX7_KTERU|nr:hypothetical protein [Ktedonosporobacter rubrisoli]QBD79827.1 hypothetical protein EPA93_29140 [Ktedonosporobacter rubrisoli]
MAKFNLQVFSHEKVEQQIWRYLALGANSGHGPASPAQRLVRDLQSYYAPQEQNEALERVWQRFSEQRARQQFTDRAPQQPAIIRFAQWRKLHRQKSAVEGKTTKLTRHMGLAAILAACALLTGCLVCIVARQHRVPVQANALQPLP